MKYTEFKQNILYVFASMKEFADLIDYSPSSISNLKQKDEIPDYLAIMSLLMVELKHNGCNPKEIIRQYNEKTKARL